MDSEIEEQFQLLTMASPVRVSPVSFDIPLSKKRRFLWIALDAFYIIAAPTLWNLVGEVRFTKFGGPVATIPLFRGNIPMPTANTWSLSQAAGGAQPGIRFEYGAAAGAGAFMTYVEIPCAELECEADKVELYVKSIRDDSAGDTTLFVAGLRIQSQ